MSIEAYDFNGRTIYVISEMDLDAMKRSGRSFRVRCPIHNSRDRDASVVAWSPEMSNEDAWLAGWGHCYGASCGVDFLVKEWNPRKARYITGKQVATVEPKYQITASDIEKAEEWQRVEAASLNKIHAAMCRGLQHHRAQAYLAQRGIAHMTELLARLEVGYIPPENEWNAPPRLRKWCDRMVFPYTTAEGERGYAGRALYLWTPGMDENEHKKVLDEHNERMEAEHAGEIYKYQIRRWEKTYRSGFFNMQAAREHKHVYLTEGTFDAIPLLYEGINNVISPCGQHFDAQALPKNVLEVTMAYDNDDKGQEAARKTATIIEKLGRAGVRHNTLCPPRDGCGKDWSERYRLHGRGGILHLFMVDDEGCPICGIKPEDHEDIEFYPDEQGRLYCQDHWDGPLPDTQKRMPDGRIVPAAAPTPPVQEPEPGIPLYLDEQERVAARAHMMAQALQGPCAVSPVEAVVTLQEHMAVQKVAQVREIEARIQRGREIRAGRYHSSQGGVA